MAFTTWEALETALLDALEDYISNGSPITSSYTTPTGRTHSIRSFDELKRFLDYVQMRKNRDSAGSRSTRVSFGRHRRFR